MKCTDSRVHQSSPGTGGMMLRLLIVCVLFQTVAGSQCYNTDIFSFRHWSPWEPCSQTCGGGFRLRRCSFDNTHETERCGATCLSDVNDFYSGACHCPPGTTGICCADIQECESNPCQNGGVCQEPNYNMYRCLCPPGTLQPNCQDINECVSNPCKNGGNCTEKKLNEYECVCPPGTTGTNCDDILECESNPCLNGGTCQEHINGYTCACVPGTTGYNCQDILECASNPCQNGGVCIEMINMYKCNCTRQYSGANCEKDLLGPRDSVCRQGVSPSCYVLFKNRETWQGAQNFCRARGGHLAVPDTQSEALFLENYLESMKGRYPEAIFWIGGRKTNSRSNDWVSGSRINFDRWPFGFSGRASGTECITMDGTYNFRWKLYTCTRPTYFVCEETTLFSLGIVG